MNIIPAILGVCRIDFCHSCNILHEWIVNRQHKLKFAICRYISYIGIQQYNGFVFGQFLVVRKHVCVAHVEKNGSRLVKCDVSTTLQFTAPSLYTGQGHTL